MQKCPFCQFENEDGALFCEQCKSDLGVSEPVAAAAQAPAGEVAAAEIAGEIVPAAPVAEPHVMAAAGEVHLSEAVPMAEVAPADGHAVEAVRAVPVAEPGEAAILEDVPAAPVAEGEASAAAVPADQGAPPAERAQLAPGAKPRLVVTRGERPNVEYPLYEGDNYVGRTDEKPVDIDLEDQESPDRVWSSRQHALITFEDGALAIEDLSSMNGTFVNRTRVHPGQKRPLNVNDVIQIGTVQMRVKV